jgi:hypothetical protein
MDSSWVVTAGSFSLYAYFCLIVALLAGVVVQHAFAKRGTGRPQSVDFIGAPPADRRGGVVHFVVEYMGNLDVRTEPSAEVERRRNLQARMLMEHIKQDLTRRGIPLSEKEHLVDRLRESIQSVEPDQAG